METSESGERNSRQRVFPVQVLLTPEQDAQLDAEAARSVTSRSNLVRIAVNEFLEKRRGETTRAHEQADDRR